MPRRDAAAAALVLTLACAGHAQVLERTGPDSFSLGDIALSAPHALRPVVRPDGAPEADDALTFRFDGNSNWLEATREVVAEPATGLSAGGWLALAAPPEDTAAMLYLGDSGFFLGLNRWRQPEVRLGGLRAASQVPLDLGAWVHLAADWNGDRLRLRVNGSEVASVTGTPPDRIAGAFAVGRALNAGFQQDTHALGAINGALRDVTFRRDAGPVAPGPPPAGPPDLDAPPAWYENDPDRPRLAPIGPTGWTNEPHALTRIDGRWHLYYQANPNGAYWRQIVWGHQVSDDLVTWTPRLPALLPGTGFDRRGVWVGNWIPGREPPAVAYTGVNGEWSGIGLAEAQPDGSLRQSSTISFETPTAYQDLRDPWVLRTEDGWLMLIGAGMEGQDEAFIFAYRSSDGTRFAPAGRFDTGGVEVPGKYWELPMLFPLGDRWVLMATPVTADNPARTLYWIGGFDGTRFLPDDRTPRQLDILATYRAPTIAPDGRGGQVAIGIVADELRDEPARAVAGWVHVLTPAALLHFCPDAPESLCQSFPPALDRAFPVTRSEGTTLPAGPLPMGGTTRLRAEVATPRGGTLAFALRTDANGAAVARLTVDAGTGTVSADYAGGPFRPLTRPTLLLGRIPPATSITLDLIFDGALVYGTMNGRPVGLLAFAAEPGRDGLGVSLSGDGAGILHYAVTARP